MSEAWGEPIRTALGEPRVIRQLPSSPRSRVWLVEFGAGPAIVKHVVGGPDADDRFTREVTALRLAGRGRPAVVPALLAADATTRVMVLEQIPAGKPAGGNWLIGYAVALAHLHGATGPADADALPRLPGPGQDDIEAFVRLAGRWDVPVPAAARDELTGLVGRLARAGGHALLHGDPCPDNVITTDAGPRFVDLEGAGLGHGATELAYVHIGFPTCWCVTEAPYPVRLEAEAAYRQIAGDGRTGDVADACVGWLIRGDALVERGQRGTGDHLNRLARRDWLWGTASARERFLHRLRVVAAVAADRADLAHIGRLSRTLHERAGYRWPGLRPLPVTDGDPLTVPRV